MTTLTKKDEMEESKELQVLTPADIASNLLKYGGKLDDLEKLMALQERHDANEARKSFHAAMAEFKKNPPDIRKTKKVSYKTSTGQTSYNHADLGNITDVIGAALAKHDLSAAWKTEQEGSIKVTCTITHALGHSESTSLISPADTSGGKNSIQAIGSTITYLQRYTLLALTGLAAQGQDDDGKKAEEKPKEKPEITKENKQLWNRAKKAYVRDGNFDEVLKHAVLSEENQLAIIQECAQ